MAKQVQLRRGTKPANAVFVGASGEVTMDTDSKDLRLHDGATVGGFRIPTLVDVQYPNQDNNYTWYRKYSDGWVEQGGVYDSGSVATSWNTTITLPVMMQNTNYTSIVSAQWVDGDHLGENGINVEEKTTSSFKIYFYTAASGDGVRAACWEVKGMGA